MACGSLAEYTLGLFDELQPEVRPQLQGTFDHPRLERSRGELPVRGSLVEPELRDRYGLDSHYLRFAERHETTVLEQHLGCIVQLNALRAQTMKQLLFLQAAHSDFARQRSPSLDRVALMHQWLEG